MTRRITREEGIFAGNSAGAAMAGLLQMRDRFKPGDVIVVIFHDHGTRYLGKMFNDDWMREKGFLEKKGLTARELVTSRRSTTLVALERHDPVTRAIQVMTEHDYSQIPVTDGGRIVGSISEAHLFEEIVRNPHVKAQPIDGIMQAAFPFVDISTGIDALAAMISLETPAVLVRDFKSQDTFIITRWDVMQALS
jgi:cystathionine beta-synthase